MFENRSQFLVVAYLFGYILNIMGVSWRHILVKQLVTTVWQRWRHLHFSSRRSTSSRASSQLCLCWLMLNWRRPEMRFLSWRQNLVRFGTWKGCEICGKRKKNKTKTGLMFDWRVSRYRVHSVQPPQCPSSVFLGDGADQTPWGLTSGLGHPGPWCHPAGLPLHLQIPNRQSWREQREGRTSICRLASRYEVAV